MDWNRIKEGTRYAYAFRTNSGRGRAVEKVTKPNGARYCVIEDKARGVTVEARPSQMQAIR